MTRAARGAIGWLLPVAQDDAQAAGTLAPEGEAMPTEPTPADLPADPAATDTPTEEAAQ